VDPSVNAARNSSCIVAIVGYHGNSVYRAVAWIPIWVTCGRFAWKALTALMMVMMATLKCEHCSMQGKVAEKQTVRINMLSDDGHKELKHVESSALTLKKSALHPLSILVCVLNNFQHLYL
jgi:hypothetical protein